MEVLEYCPESIRVLSAKYCSTLGEVLELPPRKCFLPVFAPFQDRQGITAQPRQRIDYTFLLCKRLLRVHTHVRKILKSSHNRHLPWIQAIHLCASREDCPSWRIPFSFSYWRFCHISAEKLGHNHRKHYLCSCNWWKQVAFAPVAKLVDAPDLGSGGFGRVGSSPIRRTPQNAK